MILFHLFKTTSFVNGENVVDIHFFFPVELHYQTQLVVVAAAVDDDDIAHH